MLGAVVGFYAATLIEFYLRPEELRREREIEMVVNPEPFVVTPMDKMPVVPERFNDV